MTNSRFFFSLILLLTLAARADLVGDLNHDGKLDIADFVRINAMVVGPLAKENAADLDQDGQVTATDTDMLLGLIRGTYAMPSALDYEITYEPETEEWNSQIMKCYTGEGFKISTPNNNYNQVKTSLWTVENLPESLLSEDFTCTLSRTVGISNLPSSSENKIVLDVPAKTTGIPALLFGAQLNAKGSKEKLWSYRIIEVDGEELVYKNNQLIWKPYRCLYNASASKPVSLTVLSKAAPFTRSAGTEALDAEEGGVRSRGSSVADDLGINFEVWPSEYGPSHYLTTHFLIQSFANFPLENMQRFALALEKAYAIIGELGFKQNFPVSWGRRIRVNVRKAARGEEPEDSYCVEPGLLSAPLLEFFDGVLTSDNMGSIVIHELMHYHHYCYNDSNYTCLWLEEMCTTWSERLMSDDPQNYIPKTFDDPRAVLDGLPMVSEKPSLFSDGTMNRAAGSHGYNLYPFAVWLARKYPEKEIWHAIFESRGYQTGEALTALKQGLRNVDSQADLGKLYGEFVREYFDDTGSLPYPAPSLTPLSCFNNSDAARFAANGMKTMIKASGDLFLTENIEHDFQMPQLGTATWLFTFEKGTDEFMADYRDVLVRTKSSDFDNTLYDFFILRFANGKFSLTAPEEVERDEEKNISTLRFSLEGIGLADRRTAFGIVAINHNYRENDEEVRNPLTVSLAFSGPFVVNAVAKTPYDLFINGVYRWTHDFTTVQSVLTFTPQGKTMFADSNVELFTSSYMGAETISPVATTNQASEKCPESLEFNITGTMTDIPVPMFVENSSSFFFGWGADFNVVAECTGHYVVSVEKNKGRYSSSVPFSTGEGVGEYNAVYGGMTYTAEDFAPTGPKGLSRFNVTIPEIDPTADSYTLSIETHYLEYQQALDSDNKHNIGSFHNQTLTFTIRLK